MGLKNENGQVSVEYALMIIFVFGMACVAANCSRIEKNADGSHTHVVKCVGKTCDNLEGIGYEER